MFPCLVLDCDVTSEHQVAEAVRETAGRFGGIDVLVNNAGVNAYFDATTLTEDEWDAFFAIDLKAAWLCAKHAIPHMKARGGGSIVNIASIHAVMTTPGMFPYAAAKAGLVGLTRSLALDYGPDGIRVNALCPGLTRTRLVQDWIDAEPDPAGLERQLAELQAVRRIGTPAGMGACAAFLASDDAAFVTGAVLLLADVVDEEDRVYGERTFAREGEVAVPPDGRGRRFAAPGAGRRTAGAAPACRRARAAGRESGHAR